MTVDYLVPWLNASGQDGLRNSMLVAAGDGVTTMYSINFAGGYISKNNVKAYAFDPSTGITSDLSITAGMWTGADQITLAAPVPVGQYIVIYRDTPKGTPLVSFTNGSILNEPNLDLMAEQSVFIAAEMSDRFDLLNDGSTLAIQNSATALSTANSAIAQAAAAVVTANDTIATAAAAQTAAAAAVVTANQAESTANGIDAKAQSALDNSNAAVTTANNASAVANAIAGTAQSALDNASAAVSTANAASSTANNALTTANGIDAKATQAQSDAANAITTANGAVTTANNAQTAASSGLAFAKAAANENRLINGACRIAQRPSTTCAVGVATYGAVDRFFVVPTGAAVQANQAIVSVSGGSDFAVEVVGASGNTQVAIGQKIESWNIADCAGQAVTLSGYLYSTAARAPALTVATPSNTDDWSATWNFVSSGLPTLPALPAGTWTYFTATFTLPAAASKGLAVEVNFGAVAAMSSVYLTRLQLEPGNTASGFRYTTVDDDLDKCLRYFETGTIAANYSNTGAAGGTNWSALMIPFYFLVAKRILPTVLFSGVTYYSSGVPTSISASNYQAAGVSRNCCSLYLNSGLSNCNGLNGASYTASAEL